MPNRLTFAVLFAVSVPLSLPATDSWPQFRGPGGDGIAKSGIEKNDEIPTEFGESDGVTWKTDLPGLAW